MLTRAFWRSACFQVYLHELASDSANVRVEDAQDYIIHEAVGQGSRAMGPHLNAPPILIVFCVAFVLSALTFGETTQYNQYGRQVTEFSAVGLIFGIVPFLQVEAGLVALVR